MVRDTSDTEWFASRQTLGITGWPPTIDVRFTTWTIERCDVLPPDTVAVTYRSGPEKLFVYDE